MLSLHDVEWRGHRVWVKGKGMVMKSELKSKLEEIGIGERTQVKLGCVGFRLGKREGVRRQWLALRISDVKIRIPKAHLEPSRIPVEADASDETESINSEDAEGEDRMNSACNYDRAGQVRTPDNVYNWLEIVKSVLEHTFSLINSATRHLSSYPPNTPFRILIKLLRLMRAKVIKPILSRMNQLGRHLSWIVSIFGFEVNDIQVEIDQTCNIKCSIKIGFELLRGEHGQICSWVALKNVQVYQWKPQKESTGSEAGNIAGTDPISDHSQRRILDSPEDLAISLPGRVELSARAGLDPVVGLASILMPSRKLFKNTTSSSQAWHNSDSHATPTKFYSQLIRPHSIDVHIQFSQYVKSKKFSMKPTRLTLDAPNVSGIQLALHNLINIAHSLPKSKSHHQRIHHSAASHKRTAAHNPMGIAASYVHTDRTDFDPVAPSPLSKLRRFDVELPFVTCTYLPNVTPYRTYAPEAESASPLPVPLVPETPLPAVPSNSRMSLSSNAMAQLTIHALALNLDLCTDRIESQTTRSNHIEWFGRGTSVLVRFHARWKDVTLRVELCPSEAKPSRKPYTDTS